jgi:hypothetical protein
VRVLRDMKLCNQVHILGKCPYPGCIFIHGMRPDEKGLKLGDSSHARHWVLLGSIARMKTVCLDISIPIELVRG